VTGSKSIALSKKMIAFKRGDGMDIIESYNSIASTIETTKKIDAQRVK
jgi:hypothetical protein